MLPRSVVFGFAIFTIAFFFFFPENIGIVDETAYVSMAYTFQKGEVYYDQIGIYAVPASVKVNDYLISRYPPGNSILLLPFTKLHWKLIFLRGYLLMVLGFILLIYILSHYGLPSYYVLLFLFHPSLFLYSRTIMSDLPATIFGLLGLLLFIKKSYFFAGIILGFGIAIRYPLLLIPFSLSVVLSVKKELSSLIKFFFGAIVGITPLLVYHILVFNTITGPAGANLIGFSIKNFPAMFTQFFLSINILYPLMLLISIKTKLNEKWYFIFPAVIFLIFFSLQYYIDTGKNFFETIIRGQRYMLPVIPFLLIPYAEVLERIKFGKKLLPLFTIGLIFINLIISYEHQEFLKKQTHYQNKLYEYIKDADMLICNKDIYELINPFIKSIKWESFESEGKLLNISIAEDNKTIYLACLARNEKIKSLFYELLNKTETKKKIYNEESPHFFAIYLMTDK